MDEPVHRMELVDDNGAEQLYECPEVGCGRRVVFKRAGGMVVIDQGDFSAQHAGGTVDLTALSIR